MNDIVKRQVVSTYLKLYGSDRKNDVWSLNNVLSVFEYFYMRYFEIFNKPHPRLTNESIRNIIERLPIESDTVNEVMSDVDLLPDDYPILIDAYFEQNFSGCNYSMSHFMSGNIRVLRYYEQLY